MFPTVSRYAPALVIKVAISDFHYALMTGLEVFVLTILLCFDFNLSTMTARLLTRNLTCFLNPFLALPRLGDRRQGRDSRRRRQDHVRPAHSPA